MLVDKLGTLPADAFESIIHAVGHQTPGVDKFRALRQIAQENLTGHGSGLGTTAVQVKTRGPEGPEALT